MTLQATPAFIVPTAAPTPDDVAALLDDMIAAPGAPSRGVAPPWSDRHAHDRSCFWDVIEGRWAGPGHPVPRVGVRARS